MKNKKFIYIFITLISLLVFLFAIYKIFMLHFNYKKEISELEKLSNATEINDSGNIFTLNENFKDTNLLEIDFSNLKNINNDTIGWIKVSGTNVNYPFVQTKDNSYYLTHSFYKKLNSAGWVFLDYRNNINFEDKNTIIYAHSQNNKTMFGTLKNTIKTDWLNDKNNHLVYTSTQDKNSIWQIFSIYIIPTTNDYLTINFENNFSDFTKKITNRSIYNFNVSLSDNDKILTLSTCYNKEDKLVLHAKLVKYQLRTQK